VSVLRVPIVVVATTALCWGCGGGPDITARGYAHAASRICERALSRTADVQVPSFEQRRAAVRALDRVTGTYRRVLDELRELDAPKPDRAHVDRWLASLDQAVDEANLARDALRADNAEGAAEAATRASALGTHSEGLARAYGIEACRAPDLVGTG
jgi:hypothetical protein